MQALLFVKWLEICQGQYSTACDGMSNDPQHCIIFDKQQNYKANKDDYNPFSNFSKSQMLSRLLGLSVVTGSQL